MGETERWRVSPDFPKYEVSDHGRIRHINGAPRKTRLCGGYLYVSIWHDGKLRNVRLHRLVARTYIPNPKNKPHVNHKDGNKENNNVSNLEWNTPSENERHKVGTLGAKQTPPVHLKAVICLETNCKYLSIKEAAEQMNINGKHIGEAASGKRKTASGYHWRYVD